MENNLHNADSPSEPMEEQLVAYLDGELDDESSRQIEERLASDSTLRAALSRLERTWDALDELEQVEVGEDFTRTTIEMVAVAAEKEYQAEQRLRPARRRLRWLAGIAGLAAACLAGFTVAWSFWPNPNQQLIEDLPVIERLDEYQQIDTIEFLRALHERNLFPAEANKDDNA